MKYYVFGKNSEITNKLISLKNTENEYILIDRNSDIFNDIRRIEISNEKFGIIYISSILTPVKFYNRELESIYEQYKINAVVPIQLIEYLNDKSSTAFDFIYVSTESSIKGSFDSGYAITKNAVEFFIREIYLKNPMSRVLCLAPSTITDAGMTTRRQDTERLSEYEATHPKKRFLTALEVAKIIVLLTGDEFSYLTNTTIELNGGKFARKKL
jgi:NAD(P)-dependent dehydrogenase (short-subunit alcohol dehydrogenase family)